MRSECKFLRDLVQSTIGIEVSMAKWLKEAHMVGVSVDDVNVVSILWFYHQLRVVVKTLRKDINTKQACKLLATLVTKLCPIAYLLTDKGKV